MTDSAKPTLLVVDGHSLAYRAFYALPVENFSTKDGQHTNGIYGFLSMLVNLIKAERPGQPILMLTGNSDATLSRETIPATVDLMLPKPISQRDLGSAIAKLLPA